MQIIKLKISGDMCNYFCTILSHSYHTLFSTSWSKILHLPKIILSPNYLVYYLTHMFDLKNILMTIFYYKLRIFSVLIYTWNLIRKIAFFFSLLISKRKLPTHIETSFLKRIYNVRYLSYKFILCKICLRLSINIASN